MEAGRLLHRVTIQNRVETQDPMTGAIAVTWADVATVWAAVEPLSAREFIAAQATQSQISARITIRYRAGITPKMRAVHGATVYDIAGVLADPKSGREYLTLPVSEVLGA
jgi:SPP1 family predicted phage head-tail adaptor